ncbi:MAG: IMP dehydrogenase [Gammaproteobacteria bacterium]|nr:IMP dehydrogenase [Gammaproteobacteria bacterium]
MHIIEQALTFDDVLLIPAKSSVLPKQVNLATQFTRDIQLNIPLISAAMDTVTESRLAIALAQEGGIGIVHKNMSVTSQVNQVSKVKKFESGVVQDPITIVPNATVGELLEITKAHNFSGVPVVEQQQLVGIVTRRDIRFEDELQKPVSAVMTPKERSITVKEGASRDEVISLFQRHRIEKILVINDAFQLRGMITVTDIQKSKEKPQACKDDSGRLRVGAAVGTDDASKERIEALVEAHVDAIVIDTAHGHSDGVLQQVQWTRKHFPSVQIIAGNIATGDAAKALLKVGVDAVKVGIGPGSICTTRIVAGVGVPQITAIANVAKALRKTGVPLIADGGIRYSGDICKAIAAGAHSVMLGSLLAGTEESPGEIELYKGRSYKTYRGMGSLGAMAQRQGSSDRYFQDLSQGADKLVPEGVEGRVPYKGSTLTIIHQMMGGLRSGMGYTGNATIEAMRSAAEFVQVTTAGMRESHVHDVSITKEAPNYRVS